MNAGQQGRAIVPAAGLVATGESFALSAQQRRVYDILEEIAPEVASMYQACLLVLGSLSHEEKLPLAAHAMREIFRTIPKTFGLKWDRRRLNSELNNLKAKYKEWHRGFSEGGEMPDADPGQDDKLRQFLRYYEYVATYMGGSRPEQAAEVFRALVPGGSDALLKDFAERWVDLHDYFTKVAHHGATPSNREFAAQLGRFEDCVLVTRKPEAVEDLDAIDELIGEG